jgi:hypothetical protein
VAFAETLDAIVCALLSFQTPDTFGPLPVVRILWIMDLHTAAKTGDQQRMLQLIGMNTAIDTRDRLSRTALHLASWAGQTVRAQQQQQV